MANYLGYASEYNRMGNPIAEGLNQIGETVQQGRLQSLRQAMIDREMGMREAADARTAEAQGIQNKVSLATLDINQKRAEAEQLQRQQEQAAKKTAALVGNFTKLDDLVKARRIKPEAATEFYNALMADEGINLAEKNMKIEFKEDGGYYSGEIKPEALISINGRVLPYSQLGGTTGIVKDLPVVGWEGNKPVFAMPQGTAFTEGKNNTNNITAQVVQDPQSPTGWSYATQTGGKVTGAPDPYKGKEKTVIAGAGGAPMGKAPAGYRYTPDGNLEPIPGGPAAAKAAAAQQSKGDSIAAIDLSIGTIDKLANHPGRQQATGKSRIMGVQKIPGTAAYDFDRELESFDAQLFLSNISQMKGMGALSNAEGAKVSAAAGAIKPGMSEDAFLANIKEIQGTLKKARARIESGQLVNPDGSRQGGQPAKAQPTKAQPLKVGGFTVRVKGGQ